MARFVKGEVVIVPFPFSDLTSSKRRPALVLASLQGDDIILCQITSQTSKDSYSIPIDSADFATGGLNQPSNVRPNRLFTADSNIVLYSAARLTQAKLNQVIDGVVAILRK